MKDMKIKHYIETLKSLNLTNMSVLFIKRLSTPSNIGKQQVCMHYIVIHV